MDATDIESQVPAEDAPEVSQTATSKRSRKKATPDTADTAAPNESSAEGIVTIGDGIASDAGSTDPTPETTDAPKRRGRPAGIPNGSGASRRTVTNRRAKASRKATDGPSETSRLITAVLAARGPYGATAEVISVVTEWATDVRSRGESLVPVGRGKTKRSSPSAIAAYEMDLVLLEGILAGTIIPVVEETESDSIEDDVYELVFVSAAHFVPEKAEGDTVTGLIGPFVFPFSNTGNPEKSEG